MTGLLKGSMLKGACCPMAMLEGICLAGPCLVTQHLCYCSVKPEESRGDNVWGGRFAFLNPFIFSPWCPALFGGP